MGEPAVVRHVHIVPTEGGEVSVPHDVADLLGHDAELQVGPDQVVTLRPGKLRTGALVAQAGVRPLDDPARLRHTTTSLTPDERRALAAFLGE